MELIKDFAKTWKGVAFALVIAVPAWLLGKQFEVVGGPVFAILIGMVLALLVPAEKSAPLAAGVKFTSKKVLQYAVILLGFGLNLAQIAQVGVTSLPIICSTIATSLLVAFLLCRMLNIPGKTVICAVGQRSNRDTVNELRGCAPFVREIGDCARVSNITNAVYQGYHAGLDV